MNTRRALLLILIVGLLGLHTVYTRTSALDLSLRTGQLYGNEDRLKQQKRELEVDLAIIRQPVAAVEKASQYCPNLAPDHPELAAYHIAKDRPNLPVPSLREMVAAGLIAPPQAPAVEKPAALGMLPSSGAPMVPAANPSAGPAVAITAPNLPATAAPTAPTALAPTPAMAAAVHGTELLAPPATNGQAINAAHHHATAPATPPVPAAHVTAAAAATAAAVPAKPTTPATPTASATPATPATATPPATPPTTLSVPAPAADQPNGEDEDAAPVDLGDDPAEGPVAPAQGMLPTPGTPMASRATPALPACETLLTAAVLNRSVDSILASAPTHV